MFLFNENFTETENDFNYKININLTLNDCNNVNEFNFIYSLNNEEYGLINDCKITSTPDKWNVLYNLTIHKESFINKINI